MKNFPACISPSAILTAARPTPTGNPRRTLTCLPAIATSGLTTTLSSKKADTGSSIWTFAKVFPQAAKRRQKFLEELRDLFAHLVLPVRPIVAALRAPVVQRVADAFAGKNFGEAVGRPAVFPRTRTGAEVNVAACDLAVEPGIASVCEVIDGIVD